LSLFRPISQSSEFLSWTDHGGGKRREVMAALLRGRCSENFSRSVKSPVIVRSATATLPSFLCWRSLLPSLSCSGIVVLATGRVTPCPTMKENYLPIKQTPKDCYDRSRNASRIPVKSSPRSTMFGAVCWAGARSGRRKRSDLFDLTIPATWRYSPRSDVLNLSKKADEQLLISFSEILFVSRALETTNGG
jgi:hypothetical protein